MCFLAFAQWKGTPAGLTFALQECNAENEYVIESKSTEESIPDE
jgi:hypothetical protein